MLSLIYKNILLQKRTSIIGIAYILFMMVLTTKMPSYYVPFFYTMSITYLSYISSMTCEGIDEKNNSGKIFNSLPIKRADIVISKYLSVLVYMVIYSIAILIMSKALVLTGLNKPGSVLSIYEIAISYIILCLLYTVYYPLYFKFGKELMKYASMIMFIFIILTPTVIGGAGKNLYRIKNVIDFVVNNAQLVTAMMAVIMTCFLVISVVFSINIYQNRDEV